ncbi:MAG: hypothetical protein AAFQ98_07640 [Bacteroidota bacterium]
MANPQVPSGIIPDTFDAYAAALISNLGTFDDNTVLNAYSYGFMNYSSGSIFSNPGQNEGLAAPSSWDANRKSQYATVNQAVLALQDPSAWGVWDFGNDGIQPCAGFINFGSGSGDISDAFCLTDCSGFVNHVVSSVKRDQSYALNEGGAPCHADDYANGTLSNSDWSHQDVSTSEETTLSNGNVLAWTLGSADADGDTGHVMIIKTGTTLKVDGTVNLVEVYDSSDITHAPLSDGTADPRTLSSNLSGSGAGFGTISLQYQEIQNVPEVAAGTKGWTVSLGGHSTVSSSNYITNVAQLSL